MISCLVQNCVLTCNKTIISTSEADSANLNLLSLKRGQIKSQLTRFNTFLTNFTNQSDVVELEARLNRTETILTNFDGRNPKQN